jgi:hypothetical protein
VRDAAESVSGRRRWSHTRGGSGRGIAPVGHVNGVIGEWLGES